jgi:hypothetical protein
MRFDLLEGERLSGIDVEVKDGVLICPILICLRRVESVEILGDFRVQVPPENVGNKLPTALVDVRLKILERLSHGQVS